MRTGKRKKVSRQRPDVYALPDLRVFHMRQFWGLGVATPRFWAGGRVVAGGLVDGSWNSITSYHVQEVCWKVSSFEEK